MFLWGKREREVVLSSFGIQSSYNSYFSQKFYNT